MSEEDIAKHLEKTNPIYVAISKPLSRITTEERKKIINDVFNFIDNESNVEILKTIGIESKNDLINRLIKTNNDMNYPDKVEVQELLESKRSIGGRKRFRKSKKSKRHGSTKIFRHKTKRMSFK